MASFVYSSTDAFAIFASSSSTSGQPLANTEHCRLKVLEWPNDAHAANPPCVESPLFLTVAALIARQKPQLRVIFAPLDIPTPQNYNGLRALFSHFQIPSEFLAERIHSVTHSFGWHQEDDFSHVFWLHTLCKNLELVQGTDGKLSIQDPRGSQPSQEGDGTWKRSGIFLRWKQSTVGNGDASEVDMIIFSPTLSLQKNLESLVKRPHWRQALKDPFCLLVVVLDNLFRQVDEAIAKVHNVLRAVEHVRHSCAGTPDKAAATIGSICGSQFFNFNSDDHRIMVSVDFKFFWAVTLPLTVLVFGVYLLWRWLKSNQVQYRGKSRVLAKLPPFLPRLLTN